jgi:hypothetical protein
LSVIVSLLSNLCSWPHPLHVLPIGGQNGAGLQRKGVKPAPCVNVFIGVDPVGPGFIPLGVFSFLIFFFTFNRPGGNKIETGQVIH